MGCADCGSKINGVCRVCELLDNDSTVKVVQMCGACNAFICMSCESDIGRRLQAFIKTQALYFEKTGIRLYNSIKEKLS